MPNWAGAAPRSGSASSRRVPSAAPSAAVGEQGLEAVTDSRRDLGKLAGAATVADEHLNCPRMSIKVSKHVANDGLKPGRRVAWAMAAAATVLAVSSSIERNRRKNVYISEK